MAKLRAQNVVDLATSLSRRNSQVRLKSRLHIYGSVTDGYCMSKDPRWPGVRFYPWVGEHYASRPDLGCRILLVGESHYMKSKTWSADYLPKTFTCEDVVPNCAATHPFFKRIAALFD